MGDVTAAERAKLAERIEQAILSEISKAGYRNGAAVGAVASASKMVVNRVTERKKANA